MEQLMLLFYFIFNWDSPHARLNSHYEAWSYKKKSTKNPVFLINLKKEHGITLFKKNDAHFIAGKIS